MSTTKVVKHCHVCGDVARGFNFSGLSCESCKAFFRRNADKTKSFKCHKNGGCSIDKFSRKLCRRCRLEKCYTIGMKKELIWIYRQMPPPALKQATNEPTKYDFPNIINLENIPQDSFCLQTYDTERLREIAHCKVGWPDETALQMTDNAQSLLQALNLAEHYLPKIIHFCRHFSAFSCLCQNDQMIMLKALHPEISAIGAAFLYNRHKDGLPVLANQSQNKAIFVKLDFSNELKQKEIVGKFRTFLNMTQTELDNDPVIRDLISVQLLFTNRDNVSCPEFIKYNHTVYSHLLRRYLQHKYGGNTIRAEQKYSALMRLLIIQIPQLAQMFRTVYHDEVDVTKVAQVLVEIYNLL